MYAIYRNGVAVLNHSPMHVLQMQNEPQTRDCAAGHETYAQSVLHIVKTSMKDSDLRYCTVLGAYCQRYHTFWAAMNAVLPSWLLHVPTNFWSSSLRPLTLYVALFVVSHNGESIGFGICSPMTCDVVWIGSTIWLNINFIMVKFFEIAKVRKPWIAKRHG